MTTRYGGARRTGRRGRSRSRRPARKSYAQKGLSRWGQQSQVDRTAVPASGTAGSIVLIQAPDDDIIEIRRYKLTIGIGNAETGSAALAMSFGLIKALPDEVFTAADVKSDKIRPRWFLRQDMIWTSSTQPVFQLDLPGKLTISQGQKLYLAYDCHYASSFSGTLYMLNSYRYRIADRESTPPSRDGLDRLGRIEDALRTQGLLPVSEPQQQEERPRLRDE